MGDNADLSRDSRDYGPVPLSLVRGTLWARVRLVQLPYIITPHITSQQVYPLDRVTIFRNPTTFLH